MNAVCPNCGYHLHRDNHPHIGIVRFCRRSCIRTWMTRHSAAVHPSLYDVVPEQDRRR